MSRPWNPMFCFLYFYFFIVVIVIVVIMAKMAKATWNEDIVLVIPEAFIAVFMGHYHKRVWMAVVSPEVAPVGNSKMMAKSEMMR